MAAPSGSRARIRGARPGRDAGRAHLASVAPTACPEHAGGRLLHRRDHLAANRTRPRALSSAETDWAVSSTNVFRSAGSAVAAAAEAQRSLARERWPREAHVRVRMGLDTGEAALGDGGYVGLAV